MPTRLKIRKYNVKEQLRPDAVVLMVGKRGTGKSTLLKDVMRNMSDKLDYGIAMSPTEECTSDMGSYIPPSCIYNDFNSDKIDQLLEAQRLAIKRGSKRRVFLLLDDCMYDKKVMKATNIRNVFMNGRHRRIFFANCQQYVMDMPPDLRSQIDVCFALRENIRANKEKLWKFFFGMFDTFNEFNEVMDNCTQNFECLVYDGGSRSNQVEDCIFWYKAAASAPEFKLCRPCFWKLSRHYAIREGADADDSGDDADEQSGKRDGKVIICKK